MKAWGEWLVAYKNAFTRDGCYFLSKDSELQDYCMVYRNTPIAVKKTGNVKPYDDPLEISESCWKRVEIDFCKIAMLTKMTEHKCKTVHELAIAHGLVFPDGTCSDDCNKILSAILAKRIKGVVGKN